MFFIGELKSSTSCEIHEVQQKCYTDESGHTWNKRERKKKKGWWWWRRQWMKVKKHINEALPFQSSNGSLPYFDTSNRFRSTSGHLKLTNWSTCTLSEAWSNGKLIFQVIDSWGSGASETTKRHIPWNQMRGGKFDSTWFHKGAHALKKRTFVLHDCFRFVSYFHNDWLWLFREIWWNALCAKSFNCFSLLEHRND